MSSVPQKFNVDAVLKLIGRRLAHWRDDKMHYSQEAVAQDAQIPLSTYGDMERAGRHYRIDAFIKVLSVFGLDILTIFDEPKPPSTRYKDPEHQRLHEELQELLEAKGPWPMVAGVNVDSVFLNYQSQQKKKPADTKIER